MYIAEIQNESEQMKQERLASDEYSEHAVDVRIRNYQVLRIKI